MAESIDPSFETSLTVSLRVINQVTRAEYASRRTVDRDAASKAIARTMMEHLERSRWTISCSEYAPIRPARRRRELGRRERPPEQRRDASRH